MGMSLKQNYLSNIVKQFKNTNLNNLDLPYFWSLDDLKKQGIELYIQDQSRAIFNYEDFQLMFQVKGSNGKTTYQFTNIVHQNEEYFLDNTIGNNGNKIIGLYAKKL
jgi:hypothetical protein